MKDRAALRHFPKCEAYFPVRGAALFRWEGVVKDGAVQLLVIAALVLVALAACVVASDAPWGWRVAAGIVVAPFALFVVAQVFRVGAYLIFGTSDDESPI